MQDAAQSLFDAPRLQSPRASARAISRPAARMRSDSSVPAAARA